MITFRIDFSSIFDRKIVEKLLKNQSKNNEKNKSKKHVGKAKNLEKTQGFLMLFEVPLVRNSLKIVEKYLRSRSSLEVIF